MDWADYQRSGFSDEDEFNEWWLNLAGIVQASDALVDLGLDVVIDPIHQPELADGILEVELLVSRFQTGTSGSVPSIPARERVALVRALTKRPDVMVFNHALARFSDDQKMDAATKIRRLLPHATMIWMDTMVGDDFGFDQVFEISDGRIRTLKENVVETADSPIPLHLGEQTAGLDIELRRPAQVPLFSTISPQ